MAQQKNTASSTTSTKAKNPPDATAAPAKEQDAGDSQTLEVLWQRDPADEIVDGMSPGPEVDDDYNGIINNGDGTVTYRHAFRVVAPDVPDGDPAHVANAAAVVQHAQQNGFRVTGDVTLVTKRTGAHRLRPQVQVTYLVYEAPGDLVSNMTGEQQSEALTPADVVETGQASTVDSKAS